MRCWINNRDSAVLLSAYCAVRAAVFVRFVLILVLLSVFSASAESIHVLRSDGVKLANGQVSVSTRFMVDLPQQLHDALKQGVPLRFDLSCRLTRPRYVSYKLGWNRLFGDDDTISYKLTYHPLTGRYRVSVSTFSTEYQSLDNALKALGGASGWQVLPEGSLNGYSVADVRMGVRLSLSVRHLPKPFQINALTSDDWNLDSGWVSLRMLEY